MPSHLYLSEKALRSTSPHTLFVQPYREGVNNLTKAWRGTALRLYAGLQDPNCPKELVRPLSLIERVKHLAAGLLLLVPLINTFVLFILRKLGQQIAPTSFSAPSRSVCWDRIPAPFLASNPTLIDALEYRFEQDSKEVARRLEKENLAAQNQQKEQSGNSGFTFQFNQLLHQVVDQRSSGEIANIHNFWGNTKVSFETLAAFPSGAAEAQGLRPSMEDTHLISTISFQAGGQEQKVKLSALFDGHGGKGMSDFAKEHLAAYLKKRLEEFSRENAIDVAIWNALKIALVDLSRSYKEEWIGAVGNICLQMGRHLWIANVGDARAILLDSNGAILQLSEDQKPGNPKYARGIYKRGHFVAQNEVPRIDGNSLAVARALGDHHLKGGASARPKITHYELPENAQGYHLIQCCDGVWDVASTDQVGQLAHALLKKGYSLAATAAAVVKAAFHAHSTDNLSTLIVAL